MIGLWRRVVLVLGIMGAAATVLRVKDRAERTVRSGRWRPMSSKGE